MKKRKIKVRPFWLVVDRNDPARVSAAYRCDMWKKKDVLRDYIGFHFNLKDEFHFVKISNLEVEVKA